MTPEEWDALDRKLRAWEEWRQKKDDEARVRERQQMVEEHLKDPDIKAAVHRRPT